MCILSFFQKHAMESSDMIKIYFQRHRNVAYALLHCLFLMNVINEYTMAKNDLHLVMSDEALMNKAERMTQMRRSGKIKIGLAGVADVEGRGNKHTEEEEEKKEEECNQYQRHNLQNISHVKSKRRGRLLGENVNYDLCEDNPLGGSIYGGPSSHGLNLNSLPSVGGSGGGKAKRSGITTPGLYASSKKELSNLGNVKGGTLNVEETEECTGREINYGGRSDQYNGKNTRYPEGNSHTSANLKQRRRMKKELYANGTGSGTSQMYKNNLEQIQDGRYNDANVGIHGGGGGVSQLNNNGESDFKLNYLSDFANIDGSMGINHSQAVRIGGGEVNSVVGHTDRRYHVPRGGGSDVGNDEGGLTGLKKHKGEGGVYPFDEVPTERSELDLQSDFQEMGPPNEGVLSDPTYANVELPDDELVNEVVKNRDILNNILKSRVEDMKSWSTEQRVQVLSIQKALQLKGYALH
ncbi:mRNA processing protein [Plasmodium cynomolgi strain B]|uniref:mRNA processing protein n=1 Tax=Plasmodium cynomolgi (strain B) TaxID=1120755 RepID=K6UJF6_PLACD|nr:mRNA processing protein [Plasmodium cynomolgi strain B]GAB65903.1 mRNA processing protein [Plasmodium cynomolgi strain B]